MRIRFAARMGELPEYVFGRLNAAKLSRRRAGEDIIDLGMGNPNDPTPRRIIDKLIEKVEDPRTHGYSVSADGLISLKREVARWYDRQYSVRIDPEREVVCTIGSKEGLSHLSLVMVEPGQTAIVPTPAFPPHLHSIALAGGQAVTLPLSNRPELFDRMDEMVAGMEKKPKFALLNYPHNPTTLTVEPEFYERAVQFARERQIPIVHDFAYCQITYDGYRAPSFLQAEGAKEVGVEFTSMSKSFNMAGWRIGFCVGNEEVVSGLARIKGYYDYGLFMPIQIASIIALRDCMDDAHRQAAVYESRRDVLCEGLGRIGWPVEKPKGAMFVWAPLLEPFLEMGSVDFAFMLLEEAGVAVAPGAAFGEGGDRFVRMALVENEQRLRQAVRQIGRALRSKREDK